jgi:hypothetical protein
MSDSTSNPYEDLINSCGRKFDVLPFIHEDDFIFKFIMSHPGFKTKNEAVENYFRNGENSAKQLSKLLIDICQRQHGPFELLEFASGYGCVSRHIRKVMPESILTTCDIHPQAIDFLTTKLGLTSILSDSVPEKVDFQKKYDAIFALSFFSHMPKTTWARWLKTLCEWTNPGGQVIFTTHGLISKKLFESHNPVFDEDGFWFHPLSEQTDIPHTEYGSTCVTPLFTLNTINDISKVGIKYFHEAAWWGHQDLYIVQRTSE